MGRSTPQRRDPLPFAYRYLNDVVRLVLRAGFVSVDVVGTENLPQTGGVIVASNHLSITDPPLICAAVERIARRRVRYMAKAEAFDWPLIGPLMTAYGGFGVHRGQPDRDAYRMAREVLASGDWLGLAPEGTRSRTGALAEPKPGVALLAVRSGALVLPVGIAGTERLWPVGARLPRPGTHVTIRFGEPYRPLSGGADAGGDGAPRPRREALDDAADDLMRRIAALLPPEHRGRFG